MLEPHDRELFQGVQVFARYIGIHEPLCLGPKTLKMLRCWYNSDQVIQFCRDPSGLRSIEIGSGDHGESRSVNLLPIPYRDTFMRFKLGRAKSSRIK